MRRWISCDESTRKCQCPLGHNSDSLGQNANVARGPIAENCDPNVMVIEGRLGLRSTLEDESTIAIHVAEVRQSKSTGLGRAMVELAVCLCFKDSASYLAEWLAFYRAVGVDRFYLYDNGSTDDYRPIVEPYIERGLAVPGSGVPGPAPGQPRPHARRLPQRVIRGWHGAPPAVAAMPRRPCRPGDEGAATPAGR